MTECFKNSHDHSLRNLRILWFLMNINLRHDINTYSNSIFLYWDKEKCFSLGLTSTKKYNLIRQLLQELSSQGILYLHKTQNSDTRVQWVDWLHHVLHFRYFIIMQFHVLANIVDPHEAASMEANYRYHVNALWNTVASL